MILVEIPKSLNIVDSSSSGLLFTHLMNNFRKVKFTHMALLKLTRLGIEVVWLWQARPGPRFEQVHS
jgi:hypothetical protein